jgi:hypothetical protein
MKFLCKIFGHKWEELCCNAFGLCSHRECKRCGKAEELGTLEREFGKVEYVECKPLSKEERKYYARD